MDGFCFLIEKYNIQKNKKTVLHVFLFGTCPGRLFTRDQLRYWVNNKTQVCRLEFVVTELTFTFFSIVVFGE